MKNPIPLIKYQQKLKGLALLCFCALTSSPLQAQTTIVNPTEYADGMRNPLMGLRDRATNAVDLAKIPFATVVRKYIYFNELDNNASDGLAKIKAYTDTAFKDYEKKNIKVIVRVILQFTGTQYYWPSDLPQSARNYESPILRDRVLKLVDNMGKAWDNDPRIAWVESGLIGQWGEQESPVDIDKPIPNFGNSTWAQILGPAFKNAFQNKKVQVRGPSKWLDTADFNPGVYWDTYASESSMLNQNYDFNAECVKFNSVLAGNRGERYKTVPQGGEIAYNVGVDQNEVGTDAKDTYTTPSHRRYLMNITRKIFTTSLGMEFSTAVGNNLVGSAVWNSVYVGAQELQKALGYRFLIKQFECTSQVGQDRQLNITAKVQNVGSAPFYDKWPLSVVLINPTTKAIVWTSSPLNTNVHTWYPGSNYDWTPNTTSGTGSETYLNPPAINSIQDSVSIPNNIANGTYYVGLSIIDPTTGKPGVFFSVKNFFKASNTQPLCEIGVGVPPSNPTLSNVSFDSYDWLNDTRQYSLVPTYTLTETSPNGSVTFNPAGPIYPANTVVTLTANPALGYDFTGWSGDLSGSTNPITIIMNANKSVTANTVASSGTTYTLTETSLNGSVTFSPAGPTYAPGSVVTVTSVPDSGYGFTDWAGDASGATNPTTITMNANKSVTANTAALPPIAYTLTETSPNGSVTFSPAGPSYTAGTVVTITSVPAAGYAFSSWAGDASGTTNPTTITMNGNKSVTANTAALPPITYTLTETSPNGSVTFSPAGPSYTAGTVVTITSVPAAGYVFSGWAGDATGSTNPTTLTMNSNKSIIANTNVSSGDAVPWIVNFDLPAGTTTQGSPTTWTASRGGLFRVVNNRLEINGSGGEGVFTSGVINIGGGSVNLSLDVLGGGGLDSADYVRLYTKINGGVETLVRQVAGIQSASTWTSNGITGSTLQIVIRTSVSAADEFYYLDNLSLSSVPNPWLTAKIGAGLTGSANFNTGSSTWTIAGSGSDIGGGSDDFRYVYQGADADCSVTARVVSMGSTGTINSWAKAGVMVRESTQGNARCVMLCVTPGNGVSFQYRGVTGGTMTISSTVAALTAPQWLRLTRNGNLFTAYRSVDNSTWIQVGTPQTVIMTSNLIQGMAVTSRDNTTLLTGTFESATAAP